MIEPSSDATDKRFSLYTVVLFSGPFLLLGKFTEFAITISSPCDFFSVVRATDCPADAIAAQRTALVTMLIGVVVVAVDYLVKVWWVIRMNRGRVGMLDFSCVPGVTARLESDHWLAAATQSFFQETAAVVKTTCAQAMLLQLPTLILVLARIEAPARSLGLRQDLAPTLCRRGEGYGVLQTLQCHALLWRVLILQIAWMVNYVPLIVVLMCPRLMWSPITQKAARACDERLLQKLVLLPWILGPVLLLNVSLALIFFLAIWSDNTPHGTLCLAYFIGCIVSAVFGLGVLVWSGLLWETAVYLKDQAQAWASWTTRCFCGQKTDQNTSTQTSVPAWNESTSSMINAPLKAWGQSSSTLMQIKPSESKWDSQAHGRQIVLAYTAIMLICSSSGKNWGSYVYMWSMRLCILGLMLLTRDKTSSHEDLKRHGAALGLVLDASKLQAALLKVQQGKPLMSDIPAFRANVFRIQRTLAVSYRWQPLEVAITASGMSINMSSFQIGELLREIQQSRCAYVWIDKLSVHQEPGPLQRTLLSRMLAVYSGANRTLALQTLEATDNGRYHRRAWTAQEYCAARRLTIATEKRAETSNGATSAHESVTTEEAEYFKAWRAETQEMLSGCCPFWLQKIQDGKTDSSLSQICDNPKQAQAILKRYSEVSGWVSCLLREDKLRALVPLISNVPVESQEELVALVQHVLRASRDNAIQQQWPSMAEDLRYLQDISAERSTGA